MTAHFEADSKILASPSPLAPPQLLLRALADGDLDLQVLAVALEPYRGGLPGNEPPHPLPHRIPIVDRPAFRPAQDFPRPKAPPPPAPPPPPPLADPPL